MTSEEINELPPKVRDYIHALEANADPAGTIRENTQLRETIKQVEKRIQTDAQDRKHQIYCAALTGILSNPHITKSGDSMELGDAHIKAQAISKWV